MRFQSARMAMSSADLRHGSEFVCELTYFLRFRTAFANAVRNSCFLAGAAIDAPPPFVLSFQLFEGEKSFESP